MAAPIVETVAIQENGRPLDALCRILESATIVMEEILEDEHQVPNWWRSRHKYELEMKEIDSVHQWNSWWREIDQGSPLVDIGLLTQVDADDESGGHAFDRSPLAYHSVSDDVASNGRWSGMDRINHDEKASMDNGFGSYTNSKSLSTWSS